MRRDLLKLLQDILEAGHAVRRFTEGMSEQEYLGHEIIRRAVEREFEIIGEALRRLADAFPDSAARVTAAPQIISFRNILAHGYDVVDDAIVWSIVVKRLPTLLDEVDAIRAAEYGD